MINESCEADEAKALKHAAPADTPRASAAGISVSLWQRTSTTTASPPLLSASTETPSRQEPAAIDIPRIPAARISVGLWRRTSTTTASYLQWTANPDDSSGQITTETIIPFVFAVENPTTTASYLQSPENTEKLSTLKAEADDVNDGEQTTAATGIDDPQAKSFFDIEV